MRDPFREYPDGSVDGERTPSPVTARPGASQASRLIALAASVELFRTPEGEPFATFPVGEHRETAPVKSKAFRRYLARLYYGDARATANAQAVQDALGVLEGRAVYEGETLPVYVRGARAVRTLCSSSTGSRGRPRAQRPGCSERWWTRTAPPSALSPATRTTWLSPPRTAG